MRARWILGLNLALAASAAAAAIPAVPGPLRMLGAGLLVLVLPGLGWLGLFRRAPLSPAALAVAVTGISTLATLGALIVTALGPEVPSRGLAVAWTVLVLNAGLVWQGPPGPLLAGVRWRLLGSIAALGFAVTSACALYLVPPLEDHDMELRGTAWGLAATWKPYMLTNRELYIQAAHPVLFHFHIAESLLFTGEIAATKPSYDSARRAEAAQARGEPIPWDAWWRADYRAMMASPALAGTRAPSCLLSALGLALLAQLAIVFTGWGAAGWAAAALFLSFPESLVRTSYAGYFPPTFFVSAAAILLLLEGSLGWLLAAGALAATLNHKTVVVMLAVGALAGLEALRRRTFRPDRAAVALLSGFFAGTMVWWAYGLSVHAPSFIQDHLRKHLAHRALFYDFRLGASPERYAPGMAEVWLEFNAHTGYAFVLLAVGALLFWGLRGLRDDAPWPRSLGPLLLAWFLTGAMLYTLTDWRQTKHLMNQLTPMVVASVALLSPRIPRWGRTLAAVCLLAALAWNVAADVRLWRDFGSLRISGASDIDGW